MLRSLNEIRRLANVSRAMHRATASLLALSRLLWFKGSARDDVQIDPKTKKPVYGRIGGQIQDMIGYAERTVGDVEETQVEGVMPYPIVTEEAPQLVESAKVVDPQLVELKEEALKDLARSWNAPQSIITEGPGSAQRMLNEWLQDKSFREGSIMPVARTISSALTVSFLQPQLRALKNQSGGRIDIRPSEFRIWPDDSPLVGEKELEPGDVARHAELGILSRRGAALAIGQGDNLLELPEGVTEYDWWLEVNSSRGARSGNRTGIEDPAVEETEPGTEEEEPTEPPASLTAVAGLSSWMHQPYKPPTEAGKA